jgi:SsrA-binding protein
VAREQGRKVIARNRRAYHDYRIEDTYEAGLVLTGTEVKSLRMGRASLQDGFAQITDGEVWLHNVHIPEYTEGTWTNHTPRRIRKLLLHRKEIDKLGREVAEQGLTLIPLSLYFSNGNVKVELGLGRGKRTYDKRQDLAKRDATREIDRAMKRRRLRAGGSCPLRRVSAAATPGRGASSRPGHATPDPTPPLAPPSPHLSQPTPPAPSARLSLTARPVRTTAASARTTAASARTTVTSARTTAARVRPASSPARAAVPPA